MISWVIGSGGLLGHAVQQRVGRTFTAPPIRWSDPSASERLRAAVQEFRASTSGAPWAIYWCAGAAVTSSSPEAIDAELGLFSEFIRHLRDQRPDGAGVFFLASSAGGLYGGASGAPFTTASRAVPLGPYGAVKLAQEDVARAGLADVAPIVIGRIANLYGPRQSIGKQQGLVNALVRAAAERRPMSIYVPMTTLRDYLYAEDAATMAHVLTEHAESTQQSMTAILASGRAVSIADLVGIVTRVTHRKIPIAYGLHESAVHQAADLRLVPTPHPTGGPWNVLDLPAGVRRTFDAMVTRPTRVSA